jgi:pimeloyl-ACP methyl ester carboxylesterase
LAKVDLSACQVALASFISPRIRDHLRDELASAVGATLCSTKIERFSTSIKVGIFGNKMSVLTKLEATCKPAGPGLYHLLEVLAKEKVMARIKRALAKKAMKARFETSLAIALSFWSLIPSHAQTALPDNISIVPPAPAVAKDMAAFSGAWLGTWGGELSTALVVEQINSNGIARVIYSWGDSKQYGITNGWERETGKISGGKLQFSSPAGAKLNFVLEPGGTILGRHELSNAVPSFAELHRLSTAKASAIREAAKKPPVSWREIRIPVHSKIEPTKGKTFALQTTMFPQTSPGKHPVVIFNHGSTGPGIVPKDFVSRGGNGATFFHSIGYIVVVPMRKGRGLSEGPYLEEDDSLPFSVQLDSAIEDLHAVVEYERKQSDVDPRRIVLAGASRGGFLSAAYAGRYPTNIIGVINFSGGWFGEGTGAASDFNFQIFRQAGHDAKVPMLWLYADHDPVYSLPFDESEFAQFREAGGRGELFELRDIPGNGHFLCEWVDHWQNKVSSYLHSLSLTDDKSARPEPVSSARSARQRKGNGED